MSLFIFIGDIVHLNVGNSIMLGDSNPLAILRVYYLQEKIIDLHDPWWFDTYLDLA